MESKSLDEVLDDITQAARETCEDNRCSKGLRQVDVSTYVYGLLRLALGSKNRKSVSQPDYLSVLTGRVLERLEQTP